MQQTHEYADVRYKVEDIHTAVIVHGFDDDPSAPFMVPLEMFREYLADAMDGDKFEPPYHGNGENWDITEFSQGLFDLPMCWMAGEGMFAADAMLGRCEWWEFEWCADDDLWRLHPPSNNLPPRLQPTEEGN